VVFLWANAGAKVWLLPYDVEVTGTNLGNYPLTCVVKATYICARQTPLWAIFFSS